MPAQRVKPYRYILNTRNPATPAQVGLASWLGGGSIFIVLLALATMAITCAVLLDRQVAQQALVRAQLAVTSAREQVRRDGEDLLTNARVLAERPTLPRLLESPQNGGLEPFLRRFSATTNVDVAALMQGNTLLAQSGETVDWGEITTAIQEQGERFVVAPKHGGPLIIGAAAPVAGAPSVTSNGVPTGTPAGIPAGTPTSTSGGTAGGATVGTTAGTSNGTTGATTGGTVQAIVLQLGSGAFLTTLSQQVGAGMQIVNFATYHAPPDDELTPLHTRALASSNGEAAARLARGNQYAASMVLSAQTGEVVGLLDARVNGAEFAAAIRSFDRVLLITALIVALGAGVLGMLYGRWLARPVVALRDIAERIGRGDFSAAMPAVAPLEVGALARSMDEMRLRLVDLTDALRRREAEAQAMLSGVVEGVFAVDPDRRIRYANAQVAKLVKLPANEIIGRFCGDVLRPQPVQGERPCERNCPILAARGAPHSSARELLCLSDGETRSAIVQSAPPVQGIQVQILRDETDLEAARRARDSVLGNISHEFRTPLAAQLASIELLREGFGSMGADAQRELLANVERGVLRLMRLIDNLLESVRIEAGQLSIRQQPIELIEVILEVQDLIAPLLGQRDLKIEVDPAGVDVTVRGDAQRLLQVFVNLLANAIKFAPAGSTIRIGGRRAPGRVREVELWVEDEGQGVPSASATAIFERFQRGLDAEPEAPGLGLGLWIVKSIVERHGGSVHVERTEEQRTRFVLTLPLAHSALAAPVAGSVAAAGAGDGAGGADGSVAADSAQATVPSTPESSV